ncbi:MAG TPA: amidohydrolase, partial [Candidatus Polarisedimenticolia bacterium]|nr:amidohydrolase [Candidatus Polarisedimenticolia bacterium]
MVLRSSFLFLGLLISLPVPERSHDLALTHVTLVSPPYGRARPDMTILIRGGAIAWVGPARDARLPASVEAIDGHGKFVIPGLWDMHTHFRDAERDLDLDVANGVLGVRNMGGIASRVFGLRDDIAAGRRRGPLIVACGPIVDGPDSFSNPDFTVSVRSPAEARGMVRSLQRQGADFIKVYDQLSRESYFALAEAARKQGIPLAGHIPSAIRV